MKAQTPLFQMRYSSLLVSEEWTTQTIQVPLISGKSTLLLFCFLSCAIIMQLTYHFVLSHIHLPSAEQAIKPQLKEGSLSFHMNPKAQRILVK